MILIRTHSFIPLCTFILIAQTSSFGTAADASAIIPSIEAIRSVGRQGDGFEKASEAVKALRETPIGQLEQILDGLNDTTPLAENWLRGVVFDVVRHSKELPAETIASYAMNRDNNPKGRGLAMELLRRHDAPAADRLIAQCLDDPSLPLREMAVQQKIEYAKSIEKSDPDDSKAVYRQALVSARHPNQLETIVVALRKLGDENTTVSSSFVMIEKWQALAPLDNENGVGFDAEYAPEKEFLSTGGIDLQRDHKGKDGSVRWRPVEATGDRGEINLATAYDKEKGAVCYLYAEFESPQEKKAQIRLGSKNANKAWVNGQFVMGNEVYHSGYMIDQYIGDIQLQKGTNRILLKICQNEQEESWAQDWNVLFRVTDPTGKGLLSE